MVHRRAESDDVAGIALFSGAAWNELDEVDAVPLLNAGRLDSNSGLQASGEAKLSFKAEPYNNIIRRKISVFKPGNFPSFAFVHRYITPRKLRHPWVITVRF